jgi:hypothetical protein
MRQAVTGGGKVGEWIWGGEGGDGRRGVEEDWTESEKGTDRAEEGGWEGHVLGDKYGFVFPNAGMLTHPDVCERILTNMGFIFPHASEENDLAWHDSTYADLC